MPEPVDPVSALAGVERLRERPQPPGNGAFLLRVLALQLGGVCGGDEVRALPLAQRAAELARHGEMAELAGMDEVGHWLEGRGGAAAVLYRALHRVAELRHGAALLGGHLSQPLGHSLAHEVLRRSGVGRERRGGAEDHSARMSALAQGGGEALEVCGPLVERGVVVAHARLENVVHSQEDRHHVHLVGQHLGHVPSRLNVRHVRLSVASLALHPEPCTHLVAAEAERRHLQPPLGADLREGVRELVVESIRQRDGVERYGVARHHERAALRQRRGGWRRLGARRRGICGPREHRAQERERCN